MWRAIIIETRQTPVWSDRRTGSKFQDFEHNISLTPPSELNRASKEAIANMRSFRTLLICLLGAQQAAGFAPDGVVRPQQPLVAPRRRDINSSIRGSHVNDIDNDETPSSHSRRALLTMVPVLFFTPDLAQATTGSIKTSQYSGRSTSSGSTKIKPKAAFEALVKAREELQYAQKFLPKKDYEGLREYLKAADNINAFEPNALAILSSKKLE